MFVLTFDVGRSMFDVGRSSFKATPYGINVTCECLQNNLALMHLWGCVVAENFFH